ncbi:MAG: DUF3795 domain-containing protein [Chloroflexota bacterium]|nr:DUF3795 domain-containing protein [Chloroflexota bacterium]
MEAFDNVKHQIGCCGIWCGSCVVANGTLRELTRRYDDILVAYGFEGWVPKQFDYVEFARGLASIQSMPLCSGCLKNGGREDCEIKHCVSKKGIHDCSQCTEPATCRNSELLEKMRSGALAADLFVKTEDIDEQRLIELWTEELASRWLGDLL